MTNTNIYIITPYFNPFGFKSRKRLYKYFAKEMESFGVKLLTVEAAFGDMPFEVTTPENPWNLQLRTHSVMFHKERLINLGIKRLDTLQHDWAFMGWFDADVTFANPEWPEHTVRKLMMHPIVQPFSEAINLNANEEMMWQCPSTCKSFITDRGFHQDPPLPFNYIYKGHPGLAWCATRQALQDLGGLYDTCVAGSGDTVMSNCFKGKWDAYLPGGFSEGMRRDMAAFGDRCDKVIRGNVGFTKGVLLHHWHGHSEQRGYEHRWSISAFHKFDPKTDLKIGSNGMYEWAGNKPRLEDDIRLSLSARNEDAI